MNVLVCGVTGAVGSALAPRLLRDGHRVRGLARDPARAPAGVAVVRGDALTAEGLAEAMEGIEVAYHLIHAMEPGGGAFPERERRAAVNVVGAAGAAGVGRIVYLGGLASASRAPSEHLASRLAVEEILLAGLPGSVALRASIVIGARSRSFRFLVRLIERLPVLAIPAWHAARTAPIDGRDVVEYLARAAAEPALAGRSLDIAGPEVVTYAELIARIRDHLLLARPTLRLSRVRLTPVAAAVAAAVAGERPELVRPLMEGLDGDLLPRDRSAQELLGVRPHALDAAVERALREWEAVEPLRGR